MRPSLKLMLGVALSAALTAAAADAAVLPARIAKVARQYADAGTYPAMVVVMVDDGHAQVAGFGKLADGHAPDGSTVFEIGSVTKTFTGLLLAHAVQAKPARGRAISLDTPVAQLLPDFKMPSRSGKPITLGLLAEQFSGLPRMPGNWQPADQGNPYADYGRDRLKAFLAGYQLPRDPGAAYEYSNLGFGLLGEALAEQAKLPYGELLRRVVLEPLGMRSSGVELTPAMRAHLAPGHDERGQPAQHWAFDALGGAGALLSDGDDMLRYLQANMGESKTPLAAAMQLARQPRRDIGGGDRIGLAWMTHHTAQGDVIWHNGETGGYSSFIGFTADGRRGVVILTNATGAPQELGFAALLPSVPLPVVHKAIAVPVAQLEAYVGSYTLAPGFVLTVFRREGQLFAQATGQGAFPLFASAPDAFFARLVPITIDFGRAADGKVDALTLHQGGHDQHAPRTEGAMAADGTRSISLDPALLRDYVGRYVLGNGAQFGITVQNGQLFARLTGQDAMPVYAKAKDRFFYTGVDAQLDFERDAGGKVVALVLHQNGQDQRAPRQP